MQLGEGLLLDPSFPCAATLPETSDGKRHLGRGVQLFLVNRHWLCSNVAVNNHILSSTLCICPKRTWFSAEGMGRHTHTHARTHTHEEYDTDKDGKGKAGNGYKNLQRKVSKETTTKETLKSQTLFLTSPFPLLSAPCQHPLHPTSDSHACLAMATCTQCYRPIPLCSVSRAELGSCKAPS